MNTTTWRDLPVPPGFNADDWADTQTGRPWRTIWGPEAKIGDDVVRLSALQYVDGAIETDDSDGPAIHITIGRDWGISAKHARQVAAAILEAADEADRLTQSPGTDQR